MKKKKDKFVQPHELVENADRTQSLGEKVAQESTVCRTDRKPDPHENVEN
jgi:hypothetical protein